MSRYTSPVALVAALALVLAPIALGATTVAFATPSIRAALAEGEVTWSVEPVPTSEGGRRAFEYSVDPGTQITDSVLITNSGSSPAEFQVYGTDALNDPETGAFGLLPRDEPATDVGLWIDLDVDRITLQPGEQANVPFSVVVPSDATPGDHVAGVVASVLTSGEQDGAAVTLEQRVGARLYLSISGAVEASVAAEGAVASFTPSLNPFAFGDVAVSYDVVNTGNLRVDVAQAIAVTGPFGIALGEVRPDAVANILPRQTVRVTAQVPAIAALFLAWSNVTLTPSDPSAETDGTSTDGLESATPAPVDPAAAAATPDPVATDPAVEVSDEADFASASTSVMMLAVSWTMLALVVLVIAIAYLTFRYISGTRERLYLAIDEAAEAARASERAATVEQSDSNRVGARP